MLEKPKSLQETSPEEIMEKWKALAEEIDKTGGDILQYLEEFATSNDITPEQALEEMCDVFKKIEKERQENESSNNKLVKNARFFFPVFGEAFMKAAKTFGKEFRNWGGGESKE